MMDEEFSYVRKGNKVLIFSKYIEDTPPYDREHINRAIEYTKRTKDFFASEEAYQKQIDKYEGALKFLDETANDDSIPDPSAD